MKKHLFIATFAALALIATACGKENGAATNASADERAASQMLQYEAEEAGITISYSDIAPEIMQFVGTHFPQTSIFNCRMTQHYYKVKLDDGTKLKFTHSFDWVDVDCEHSTIYTFVPASLVPEQITAYVTANHPDKTIEEIEKNSNGNWDVELRNGPELKFDTNFNVISGGNNGGGNGGNTGGNTSNYPEINTFVEIYFPQVSIRSARQDGNEIEVKLTDNTELDFYLNYDWKNIDCDESTVYGIVPAELVPTQITDYVTVNFPANHIDQIEKENYGWDIELDNNREIKFDHNFNVISGGNNGGGNGGNTGGNTSNYPEINTFVETYFPQVSIRSARQDGNEIEVKLTDNTELDFYLNYDWKNIDCDESTVYGIVPAELVPTQITDYVTVNFPANHIDQIEKENYGWDIELDNNREIKFDHNFNVISGGNNGGGNGGNTGGNTSNYPEINTFVETYFPQVSIRSARQDGNEIEVKLTDNTELDFYLNYDWKNIDCEKGTVYGSVPAELVPAQITAYVAANFAGKTIESIEKKHNGGWEIELSNGLEIKFDANFNVIEIDNKK